jgi:hypothetical protein
MDTDIPALLDEAQLILLAKQTLTGRDFKFVPSGSQIKEFWGPSSVYISPREFDEGTIQGIGARMPDYSDGIPHSGMPNLWNDVLYEMHSLICTDDKRYADLRKALSITGSKSQTTIVSLIAAAVAAHIGLIAGSVVPFCALVLVAVARVGKNAYCRQFDNLDINLNEMPIVKGDK